ncbi:hypothetical protein BJ138DRAFT_1101375 [Hygrophoropsis aurantiaca]|uniref:Uncharacterized protein n=1 Tax=Hygrophoropsis aurantiaca TaxID=72124 RepID=A0ACB8ACS0_9AGAM|nr:hypothetical protein BJ138DRAFT_1101375 [Hygrophoropsis aurantiaca]
MPRAAKNITNKQSLTKTRVPKAKSQKANTLALDATETRTPANTNKENFEGDEVVKKKSRVFIPWSKDHSVTDELLTLIEDSTCWKVAFGFDKGMATNADTSSKGKTVMEHCADIARALFITGKEDSKWTEEDVVDLKGTIKNRMASLKTFYIEYRNQLGETGHGLVISGREDEITANSAIANAFDLTMSKFPWYKRMHELMGTSPVVSRAAVSNSTTPIDTSILNREDDYERSPSPVWDIEMDQALRSSPGLDSRAGSPGFDDSDFGKSDNEKLDNYTAPITPAHKVLLTVKPPASAAPTPTKSATKKRQTPQDFVKDVADAEREARLRMTEINAKERTAREEIKRRTAHNTALEVERLRLKYQHNEMMENRSQAIAQREHERIMIEKQIELERVRAGFTGGSLDPQLRGGSL